VTWAEFVRAVVGDESGKATSLRIGQSESAVSRWKTGQVIPMPREAVAFARAYGRNPLEALVAAEYLSEEEVAEPIEVHRTLQLRDFTDLELVQETLRRVSSREEHELLTRDLNDSASDLDE
jgi:hypothetical protein